MSAGSQLDLREGTMRQVSVAAWALSLTAIALILSTHLWPQLLNPYRPEDYIDGPIYEPNWQPIGDSIGLYAFEVIGLTAFCLHGYSQSGNRPRLALAFGLISGVAAFMLIVWSYYRVVRPLLERLTVNLDDPVYWAFITAD